MAFKRDRISIEVFGPSAALEARNDASRANEAVLILARLIGRQIAREQFNRAFAEERKARNRTKASEAPQTPTSPEIGSGTASAPGFGISPL